MNVPAFVKSTAGLDLSNEFKKSLYYVVESSVRQKCPHLDIAKLPPLFRLGPVSSEVTQETRREEAVVRQPITPMFYSLIHC